MEKQKLEILFWGENRISHFGELKAKEKNSISDRRF